MESFKRKGFVPDVVIGHAGWGETLYAKDVFPDAKLINYFEFFYHATGADTDFDPEYPNTIDDVLRIRTKNSINLLALESCDAGISATQWQKSLYPSEFQPKISVIYEGVNTDVAKPDAKATFTLPNGKTLTSKDKVVTFVSRNLEPYRGFHSFMRAIAEICQRQPDCHVLILGGDEVSYGRKLENGQTYRAKMLQEVNVDANRVHFLGKIEHAEYIKMLQISSAHVYLTVPFVLSWSMLEAMAAGCLVIGSKTAPVLEVLNAKNGVLVDFFSASAIAKAVDGALKSNKKYVDVRKNARETILNGYGVQKSIQQYEALFKKLKLK